MNIKNYILKKNPYYGYCLLLSINCDKDHDQNKLGRKEFIGLYYQLTAKSLREFRQGRNLEAGTQAETMLTALLLMECPDYFLISSRTT